MSHYDVCIIGAGMFGSAAAKYCQIINSQKKTILIGPEEPEPAVRLSASSGVLVSATGFLRF